MIMNKLAFAGDVPAPQPEQPAWPPRPRSQARQHLLWHTAWQRQIPLYLCQVLETEFLLGLYVIKTNTKSSK